jgi:hypothetical protein
MNLVVADHPDREIHVIFDNLNTHKPKHDRRLARHKNVHFHFTPTHASWLNEVGALAGASFTSPRQLRGQIDAFNTAYNQDAHLFEWTKQVVFSKHPRTIYANLYNKVLRFAEAARQARRENGRYERSGTGLKKRQWLFLTQGLAWQLATAATSSRKHSCFAQP